MRKQQFLFVEYDGKTYPPSFPCEIKELAAHFDKSTITYAEKFSLHTEYSYGKRRLDSCLIQRFPALIEAQKDGVPQLWKSVEWASQFADFIISLAQNNPDPTTIEIHPPFNDYCNLEDFIKVYSVFENKILTCYPNTNLVIENRAGAVYRGGRFLISTAKDIVALCDKIKENNLSLGLVLDFPQLLTAERIDTLNFNEEKYSKAINALIPYRSVIKGIHVWGKKKSDSGRWVAHCGNFDTFFGCDSNAKSLFLQGVEKICDDNLIRYFVPEVNSTTSDLNSILKDLFE